MRKVNQGQSNAAGRSLDENGGGWAFFGRLLVWSTRNNCRKG